MTTTGDDMGYWDDIARALEGVGPICPNRAAMATLWKTVVIDDTEGTNAESTPDGVVRMVCATGRVWLVQLGQDPDTSRTSFKQTTAFCQGARATCDRLILLLRYVRVELSAIPDPEDKALEQLREARLSSFGKTDTRAVPATTRMHDGYPGVTNTTVATPKRAEVDPVESVRGLDAVLVPYLAHQRIIEAEDAFASLNLLHLPDAISLQSLADRFEYLGLSLQ